MKAHFFILFLSFILICNATKLISQTAVDTENIVPNASFEEYANPPIGWFYKGQHFTNVVRYWSAATAASPDVFGPRVRVPNSWAEKGFGKAIARSGYSMAGITVYGCDEGKPHCREYVQVQLLEPLVLNQTYYVEFWVSHLPNSLEANNIGIYFSDKKITVPTDEPLNFTPQVKAETVLRAANQRWVKVSGKFQAKSPADYLIIGNFYSDNQTQTRSYHSNELKYAYYYIDDVFVKKLPPILEVPIRKDDLSRVTIEEGKIIPLRNIFFDTDKSELLPRSYLELKKLLKIMRKNPSMIIEVRGHTDSIGEDDYNRYLSRKRSKAVVEYLNSNGISPHRTHYRGYGSGQPIASNETMEGRQLNRRVEFLVVKK